MNINMKMEGTIYYLPRAIHCCVAKLAGNLLTTYYGEGGRESNPPGGYEQKETSYVVTHNG